MLNLSAALFLLAGVDVADAALMTRIEQAPKPISAFIERRANCNHFLGEEPYDRERAAELDKALGELRCATLDRDEAQLRRGYRDDAPMLQLLDETEDLLGL